ncbi:MAG: hypothetical protein LBR68_00730 [Lachnoclostridium sp.]|jgi:transglutaminase/protease-like cytokinesis protein 3|nr:hypothetical protein [Lachnoclostridium sp.]
MKGFDRMKKTAFVIMFLFCIMFLSSVSRAEKTYYIVSAGKEYKLPKSSYELLHNDRSGTLAKYIFTWYRIPIPKNRKYVLRVINRGIEDSESKASAQSGVSLVLKNKTLKMLTGDFARPEFYGYSQTVTWKSMNNKIIKPMADGRLKAKKSGTTTVFTLLDGRIYKCKASVTSRKEDNHINSTINSILYKGMKKREQIKEVHDWMISHIKYDYSGYLNGKVSKSSHTSEGALLKRKAVCDGYASAFKKFMDKLGIECHIVYGYASGNGTALPAAHAWNRVRLGGKWKYIDVTYDDPIVNGKNTNQIPFYDFFLKPRKKMNRTHTFVRFNL